MNTHYLNNQTFYLLSGPSASGKSFFTKQLLEQGLPEDAIVSTDTIRKQILGFKQDQDENGIKKSLYGWSHNQNEIFKIIDQILSIRFSQKLPTIYDATNLTDSDRASYVKLATKFGIDSHIIIIDTDPSLLKDRLSKRIERFDYSVVEKQLEKFQKESIYPFTVVTSQDKFIYNPLLLSNSNLLVIGDTHAMLEPLKEALIEQGFEIKNQSFYHPEKKLVFLGDALDRGEESLNLFKMIINTVKNGDGFFLLGNHENKLIQSYEIFLKDGTVKGKSLSSSQTFLKFLSLPDDEKKEIYEFLIKSPTQLNLWINKETLEAVINKPDSDNYIKIGMLHANNNTYNPHTMLKSEAIYGHTKIKMDSDELYDQNYLKGINKYILLRGHIKETSKQNHIYSLEDDQAFNGNLMFFDMKNYLINLKNNNFISSYNLFESATMKKPTNYNFDDTIKETVDLLKGLHSMVKEGLVTDGVKKNPDTGEKIIPPDGLKIYKYAKKVHFKRLWKTNPLLEKARGLVLDDAGNIVVHPFNKIYNYEEYDTGKNINPDKKVYCVEKLNGFLGCISKHPFKNEILVSTTGSLTSDYVDYIKDFVDEKLKNNLLEYFKNNNKTLMFEVLHPKDTENHIVPYTENELGLWLIGARGRKLNDNPETEEALDAIAQKLDFKRPSWEIMDFNEVIEKTKTSQLEGYMVRDAQSHDTLMKIKTNYYLVTKFVGRMSPKRVEMMFSHPEKFKENNMEEEFYPLVDQIVKLTDKDKFLSLEQTDRVSFVRDLIIEQRKPISKKPIF